MRAFADPMGPTPEEACADMLEAFEREEEQIVRLLHTLPQFRRGIAAGRLVRGFVSRLRHRRLAFRKPSAASYVALQNTRTGERLHLPFA